jgi:hypothetical protein
MAVNMQKRSRTAEDIQREAYSFTPPFGHCSNLNTIAYFASLESLSIYVENNEQPNLEYCRQTDKLSHPYILTSIYKQTNTAVLTEYISA